MQILVSNKPTEQKKVEMKEAGSVLEQEQQEVIEQREDASSKPKQIQSASRRGGFLVVEGVVPSETSVV